MKLYVGNLSFSSTEADVKAAFETYGDVDSVNLITDRETGRAKGFGFVEMSDDQAKAAIEGLNGTQLGGRSIVVNEARPKEDRPARGGFGGGRDSRGGRGGNRW